MFVLWCLSLIVYSVCAEKVEIERKLNATLNPGCPVNVCPPDDSTSTITLVHVTATGSDDVIHYLWDLTGKPSVLLAVTPLDATVNIKWDQFMKGVEKSVSFSVPPVYTFTVVLNKIMEFNDLTDIGQLDPSGSQPIRTFHMKDFVWKRTELIKAMDQVQLEISSHGYHDQNMTRSGLFSFVFKSFNKRDHGFELPHLLHSANCSQVDLVLENIQTDPLFDNSRFAIEVIIVSQESPSLGNMTIDTKKSLDDEHTPGIFEVVELLTPKAHRSRLGGFMQYRPVSYTVKERDIASSTETHHSAMANISNSNGSLSNSMALAYYGADMNGVLVQGYNVSFGLQGDGFYKKSNFTTWTFTVGYGYPPAEEFSLLVILVISIGLGIPFVLLICGGLFLCIRRLTRRRRESAILRVWTVSSSQSTDAFRVIILS